MNHIFGIDGNNYLYRAFCTIRGVSKNKMGQALAHRMLNIIGAEASLIKASHLMVGFDGGENFRYQIYPLYKSSRDGGDTRGSGGPPSKEVYAHLSEVIDVLTEAGIHVVQKPNVESDDILASLASNLPKDSVLTLGTGDKDMYQILRRRVRLMYKDTYRKEYKFMYLKDAEAKWGVSRESFIDYQVLLGDGGDDIPKIMPYGVGPVKIASILNEHGSIKAWYRSADKDTQRFLIQHQHQIKLNRLLVTLLRNCYKPDLRLMVPKPTNSNLPAPYAGWLNTLRLPSTNIYSSGRGKMRRSRI